MSRKPSDPRRGSAGDKRIIQIVSILKFQPWLRSRHFAPMFHRCASRLEHLFVREMGVRIGDYGREIQLQKACALLIHTHKPIKQICHDVGISDRSSFWLYFKRRFKMSPSDYRRRFQAPITVFPTK